MTAEEKIKKVKEKLFCDSIATFVLFMTCVDWFFLDFNIEYFANNIMWFFLIVILIVSNIHSIVLGRKDYKNIKETWDERGEL